MYKNLNNIVQILNLSVKLSNYDGLEVHIQILYKVLNYYLQKLINFLSKTVILIIRN